MSTLFISDLHLEDRRPATTQLFLRFLQGPARTVQALYILGDLFDAWIGDDAPGRTGLAVARGLSELAAHGVPIRFMHGNRDFLIGDGYCRQAGMTLLSRPTVIDLYGIPTLITHGDELCTGDTDYQQFRAKVRDPEWQRRMLRRPVALRRMYARAARFISRTKTAAKPAYITDVEADAVIRAFQENDVTRIIHGHTHRPAVHELTVGDHRCQRVVLGDWFEQGSLLRVDAGGAELLTLPGHR